MPKRRALHDHRPGAGTGTIRAAALLGFRNLVADLGADAELLLASSGIDPRALSVPESRISYAAMIGLLESCSQQLDCPDFGLRLSRYQDIDILGPAAMIAHYSDTVGDSLRAITSYFYVHTTAAAVQLSRSAPGSVSLSFDVLVPDLHAKRQINELSLAVGQSLLEMLVGSGFRSDCVRFSHRQPDDLRPLTRRFGRQLHFNCSSSSIEIPVEVLTRPVPMANAEFRNLVVEYIREHLGSTKNNRRHRIEVLVHQLLPTGRCSLQTVSDVLGMHPRTLQRELRQSDTDFRHIVDRVRRELVAGYLRDTDASLTAIAAMLGYSDQAGFSNAFQRWYGMPPGHWRQAAVK